MKKQKNGRYKSKVVVGTRSDGTKITKYISGTTKRELEEARQRVIREYRDGSADADHVGSAADWVLLYFDTVTAPGQKAQTAKDIRKQIVRYIVPTLQDKQLRAVTFLDLQSIMNGLEGKGRTLTGNVLGVLRRSFSAAYSAGYIPRDVSAALSVRLPSRQSNRALSDDEIVVLKKNLAERRTEPLLMGLLYYTGMRRGEVLGLKWSDIDLKNDVIHVRRDLDFKTHELDSLKTNNAERDIPVVGALKELLLDYRKIGNTFVISSPRDPSKPLSEKTYQRKWKRIQALFGSEITSRTFRNNFATVLYDAGVDVLTASKAMGHADPATTLKIYTDLERSRKVRRGSETVKSAFDEK